MAAPLIIVPPANPALPLLLHHSRADSEVPIWLAIPIVILCIVMIGTLIWGVWSLRKL